MRCVRTSGVAISRWSICHPGFPQLPAVALTFKRADGANYLRFCFAFDVSAVGLAVVRDAYGDAAVPFAVAAVIHGTSREH